MWSIFLLTLALVTVTRAVPLEFPSNSSLTGRSPEGRIVGGHVTSIIQHPYQVGVRHRPCEDCEYRHSCGGSIYSARIIITAAHCVVGRYVRNFMIVAGTNYRTGSDGAIMRVKEIIMHEKYWAENDDYDIALMILSDDLPINNVTIKPIALVQHEPANGAVAVVSGWGRTLQGGASPDVLLEVEVPIIGLKLCNKYFGDMGRITPSMLCAGVPEGGKDSCQGDSGGPLVIGSKLAGVVSWGDGCGDPGLPGVYANVAYLYDWLMTTVHGEEPHIDFL